MGSGVQTFLDPSGTGKKAIIDPIKSALDPRIKTPKAPKKAPAAPPPPSESAKSVRRPEALRNRKRGAGGTGNLRIPLFGFEDPLT